MGIFLVLPVPLDRLARIDRDGHWRIGPYGYGVRNYLHGRRGGNAPHPLDIAARTNARIPAPNPLDIAVPTTARIPAPTARSKHQHGSDQSYNHLQYGHG